MISFYVSRINITSGNQNKSKNDLIKEVLFSNHEYPKNNTKQWMFYNCHLFEGYNFIKGYFIRFDREKLADVVDESLHSIIKQPIQNAVISNNLFFIDLDNELIYFNPNKITNKRFEFEFSAFLLDYHDIFFIEVDLKTISKDKNNLKDKIKLFKAINQLFIALKPSNPNSIGLWEKYDKRFQRLKVNRYEEKFKGNINQEELQKDEEINGKFLMAEDGYGFYQLAGLDKDEKPLKIDSNQNPLIVSQEIVEDIILIEDFIKISKSIQLRNESEKD